MVPKLGSLEAQIRRKKSSMLIGRDLKVIRDEPRYYRPRYKTWDSLAERAIMKAYTRSRPD